MNYLDLLGRFARDHKHDVTVRCQPDGTVVVFNWTTHLTIAKGTAEECWKKVAHRE